MADSWYSTGYDPIKKEEERQAQRWRPNHFWTRPGESRELMFVDDEPTNIYEHNPKLDGHFRNWVTCLSGVHDPVVCCEVLGHNTKYYVGYYTVIDCTENVGKDGKKYQFELKLLPAKIGTLKVLQRKKNDRKSLVGHLIKVTRDTKDDPNVGNEFEFLREVPLEKMLQVANYRGKKLPEWLAPKSAEDLARLRRTFAVAIDDNGRPEQKVVPFNYHEILRPVPPKELKGMLAGFKAGGGSDTPEAQDDVPF